MRILVIEDQNNKYAIVEAEIRSVSLKKLVSMSSEKASNSLAVASKLIYENRYDLIVIDLMMPLRPGEKPQDISEEIISTLELSERNKGANVIALSGYEELVAERKSALYRGRHYSCPF